MVHMVSRCLKVSNEQEPTKLSQVKFQADRNRGSARPAAAPAHSDPHHRGLVDHRQRSTPSEGHWVVMGPNHSPNRRIEGGHGGRGGVAGAPRVLWIAK